LRIGRGGDCDLQFDDAEMSRVHLILRRRDGKVSVEDSSLNGSSLDGQRLSSPNTPFHIRHRCEITKNLSFELIETKAPSEKTLLKNSKITLLLEPSASSDEIVFGEPSIDIFLPDGQKISRDVSNQGLSI